MRQFRSRLATLLVVHNRLGGIAGFWLLCPGWDIGRPELLVQVLLGHPKCWDRRPRTLGCLLFHIPFIEENREDLLVVGIGKQGTDGAVRQRNPACGLLIKV